jgi:hypothetical protein
MTKRTSKKVLKVTNNSTNQLDTSSITNNNTNNFNNSASSNSSSNSIPPSTKVVSINSTEDNDVILETGKNLKQNGHKLLIIKYLL